MILFFDTSALVKFFHREEGTDVAVSIIAEPNNEVWVSELARLEFMCALHRKVRVHALKSCFGTSVHTNGNGSKTLLIPDKLQ